MPLLTVMEYINVWNYINKEYPFQIFIGGRGTGKTYSALTNVLQSGNKFIYMRRTQDELDMIVDGAGGEGANPFKPINTDLNVNIGFKPITKKLAGVYRRVLEETKLSYTGAPIGYGVALSTISGIRGMDFSDVQYVIYDEFIPELHVRKMKGEGSGFFNAVETINRNRELKGIDPPLYFLLANSNNIYNPLFIELGIVNEVEKLIRSGKKDKYLKDRGLAIHLLEATDEFKNKKSKTAIYKLTKGTKFNEMALDNTFSYNDFSLVVYHNVTGYRPICSFGKAYIYKKKGTKEIYVSYAPAKCESYNSDREQDIRRFNQHVGFYLVDYYTKGKIFFESYDLKELILNAIL